MEQDDYFTAAQEQLREEQELKRVISQRSKNIEKLAADIKQLRQVLEEYRVSTTSLSDATLTEQNIESKLENEAKEMCERLGPTEIQGIMQTLRQKKVLISAENAKLRKELQDLDD
ncbi:uncharacterized protein LOC116618004 [Nematostella vectensis]|uniref:uncharacterized protein LOC116618004 n=1 Tax=Nematostella vectensis TaxID=45351 RepID=UPI0013900628|nr:uncharacterized protein LOC116618004 [Nematostella vectensis]